MDRSIDFREEHVIFRETFRRFLQKEIADKYEDWEQDGIIPREIWKKFGDKGYLIPWVEEEYGGSGADFLYSVIIEEEIMGAGFGSLFMGVHNDIIAPFIHTFGDEEQKKRWLPGCATGEKILAVAMTEPDTGSDLVSIKTRAKKEGSSWVLNGQKTFISNGILSDIIIVAAKTEGNEVSPHEALSLFVVERGAPGFSRGKQIKKIGLLAQDTAELFFDDCRIPEENLLGETGMGFKYLMEKLRQERLVVTIGAQAAAEKCFELTVKYVKEREQFGKPLSKFQNTQFVLAELASEIAVGRSYVDDLINNHMAGSPIVQETSMGKLWVTEMLNRVTDRCLQLFGGYGFCTEYPVSRFFTDARIQTIYAGTSEVMKLIISKGLGL